MASADEILDTTLRHAIDMERYKNGVVRRIVALLNQIDDDIMRQISDVDLTDFAQSRLLLLEQNIVSMIDAGNVRLQANLEDELRELVNSEIDFYDDLATAANPSSTPTSVIGVAATTRLNTDDVYAAAIGQPFRGRTLGEWFDSLGDQKKRKILDEIRIGFIEGESTDSLVRRLRGTPSGRFNDGVLTRLSRHNVETIVRTAVQYFNNFALKHSMERAQVEYWQFVAVLDRRTSAECRGRSNKVYKVGDKSPWPPRHPRCRSVAMPLLSEDDLPNTLSYNDWLKKQPELVINEILGKRKARLFLAGNLELDSFTSRQGDELTLTQLRRRHPQAWLRSDL